MVDGGRATGVVLADGRELRARQFVASAVDVPQTFGEMIELSDLPAEFGEKVKRFHHTNWTLFGLHLALREPPRYASNEFDPNINRALKYNIGSESVASLQRAHQEVEAGQMPTQIQFGAGALTQIDPTQAPAGAHTAYAWHVVPYAPAGDPEGLNTIREEFADRIVEKWRHYAPNMTPDNILARHTYTAYEYSKELINMKRGDIFMGALSADQVMYNHFGYTTPIQGLFMAGSATHPNGGISGGSGYIAAGIIAQAIGARLWWTPRDAERELLGAGVGI
jgi:phytoene dehydrogenase-like protein